MQEKKRPTRAAAKGVRTLGDAFDIPKILNPSIPHIETEGNREVVIDGCRGILEYGDDVIKVNAGSLIIAFRGADMTIKTYSDSQSVITGNIAAIEFSN